MKDWLLIAMLAGYAFWFGYDLGLRRERKRAALKYAGAIEFERSAIAQAKKLKRTLRYTGENVVVTSRSIWTVRDVGEFQVEIKDAEQKQGTPA